MFSAEYFFVFEGHLELLFLEMIIHILCQFAQFFCGFIISYKSTLCGADTNPSVYVRNILLRFFFNPMFLKLFFNGF